MEIGELPVINIHEPEFWQSIYPDLHRALDQHPCAQTIDGALYVLGYDEVDAVLKDRRFLAADLLAMMGLNEGPVWEWWTRVMFSNNDPIHGRLRKLVNRAFTPPQVERKRETIRTIARNLLGEVVAAGSVDVMATVAHNLPSMVMATLLDIPESDREQFARWTTDIGLAFGAATDPVVRAQVEQALAGLDAYVAGLVEDRRGRVGTDLLSELIVAEEAGDKLSTRELIDMVENLLFAGHDTTRGSAGVLLALMETHPEMLDAVRTEDEAAKTIVEEILRYEAITFATSRCPDRLVEVAGVEIEAGTPVALCMPAASRDPRRYPEPDRFDVGRKDANPPTFGAGAHYCIGAWLARAELQELLRAAADLLSGVAVEEEPQWTPFAFIRRYDSLQMRFDAA